MNIFLNNHPRVLIVGTIPYNKNTSSRAFDAYFHNWETENLRQIFSDPNRPIKGHCSSLFQITDKMMLMRRFKKCVEVGTIYEYENLEENYGFKKNEKSNGLIKKLYSMGKRKMPFNRLARKWLWKKIFWNTEKLQRWLDEFNPECVFLAFSDDFFINEIALFVADRFNVPIMTCIGDDYYFNDKNSISPLYHIYRKKYKRIIEKVFAHRCSAIYISDKIREKYNKEFNIKGDTVYLTSDIPRRDFRPIDRENPKITYCGNIRLGRNFSLINIANALFEINENYKLEIYSAETDKKYIKPLKKCKNIVFKGKIPYSEVITTFATSDIVLIVEGFSKKDVNLTRYSLSTKAADSISSGCQIITYGSGECGVIEYMQGLDCSLVCTDKSQLVAGIKGLIYDVALQRHFYNNSFKAMIENHNLARSNAKSEQLFKELISEGKENV